MEVIVAIQYDGTEEGLAKVMEALDANEVLRDHEVVDT